MTTSTQRSPQQRSRRDQYARAAVGLGLVLGAAFTWLGTLAATLFVNIDYSSTCELPVDRGEMHDGRVHLGLILLAAAVPWTIWALASPRHRTAVTIVGLVAVLPAAAFIVWGLKDSFWTNGWCL
jgi:hypothetical protein